MDVVVISIGEELLQGRILDTNANFISGELLKLGLPVNKRFTIGDKAGELTTLVNQIQSSSRLIICCGGLGPTVDDRVRAELAEVCGQQLIAVAEHHQDVLQKQAMIPELAKALRNRRGTAWGFACQLSKATWVISLPGPPVECRNTFLDGGGRDICRSLAQSCANAFGVFHTAGLPESKIERALGDLLDRPNLQIGINASPLQVSVSVLTQSRPGEISAEHLLEKTAAELKQCLGELLWGRDQQSLERVVVAELMRQEHSVATAESCTGGLVAAALTSVAGASQVFGHGWTTYSNHAKQSQLNVSDELIERYGAVSAECATAMAVGARQGANTDWAVAATGIAGPSGGTEDKPVGLVYIGVAGPSCAYAVRRRQAARSGRLVVQQQTVRDCLDALRRELLGLSCLPERP